MTATVLRWLAAQDGIAHAYRGAAPWALCGRPVILERLAWPAERRCKLCELREREGTPFQH